MKTEKGLKIAATALGAVGIGLLYGTEKGKEIRKNTAKTIGGVSEKISGLIAPAEKAVNTTSKKVIDMAAKVEHDTKRIEKIAKKVKKATKKKK